MNEQFDFSDALTILKRGGKVRRSGWNGKGMWLRYYEPYRDKEFPIREIEPCEGTPIAWIGMKTADQKFVPWLCSQTDMLATDWEVVSDVPTTKDEQIIRRAKANRIPIFVLTAKDEIAASTIDHYRDLCKANECSSEHIYEIGERYEEFRRFKKEFPERMKLPD